jgi:hypothetical protein
MDGERHSDFYDLFAPTAPACNVPALTAVTPV